MTKKPELTQEEIQIEKLSIFKQLKVFLMSIILIPLAIGSHTVVMFLFYAKIPNTVIDMISLSEKIKQANKRKLNG